MKKVLKSLLVLVLLVVVALAGLLGWLTLTEYNPDPIETLEPLKAEAVTPLPQGATLDILSWNIGYAGLGAESDFIMDGGQNVRAADEATVQRYLDGINEVTRAADYSFVILQEVDTDSSRTYNVNEAEKLSYGENAERQSLPCPFSWPLRIANLKRCLLVSYVPIEGTDKYLVLVNLHLEAYDDGEGKIAQTKQLREFIENEYKKGNYVIAGGDFNQIFPGGLEKYPNSHGDLWTPGILGDDMLPEGDGWRFVYDLNTPSCRLLNQPYDPTDVKNTQYYVIDGFIISPNVQLEFVKTLDLGFENSDHNPVHIQVTLVEP